MIFSITPDELSTYINKQLDRFFPDGKDTQDGIVKVLQGLTDIREIRRVCSA